MTLEPDERAVPSLMMIGEESPMGFADLSQVLQAIKEIVHDQLED